MHGVWPTPMAPWVGMIHSHRDVGSVLRWAFKVGHPGISGCVKGAGRLVRRRVRADILDGGIEGCRSSQPSLELRKILEEIAVQSGKDVIFDHRLDTWADATGTFCGLRAIACFGASDQGHCRGAFWQMAGLVGRSGLSGTGFERLRPHSVAARLAGCELQTDT